MAIDVGSRIRDYEIIARLKAGGMATLFLARRVGAAGFSRHVAIKVVHPHLAEDQGFIRMFIDEALLSARIQHPNVVHVEELGEDKGTYFLAMEYVHGSALSTLLGSLAKLERRLAPDIAVWIAMRLADGLHAAHELRGDDGQPLGVVHRDVSPQNVLLSMSGNVKLIDFGIAKAAGSSAKRTETGSLKGKLRYMAPEQAYGHAVDRRTDVYALGIVLWEMLTMHRMFSGANDLMILDQVRAPRPVAPSQLAPGIPPELDRVVLSALSPDPAARPPTAQDFRRWLGDALPAANNVDAGRVAEVLEAVLGERLEARRAALPESLSGVALPMAEVPEERSMKRGVALRTMTLSAPGVQYHADQEVSVAPVDFQDASRRTGQSFASPPAATPAAPSMGRDRLVALVAAAIALVAVSVLAGVLIAGRMGGGEPPTTTVVVMPPPTTVLPAALPPPTTTTEAAPPSTVPSTPTPTTVATPDPVPPPPTTGSGRHGVRRRGSGTASTGVSEERPSSVTGSVPIYDDGFDD